LGDSVSSWQKRQPIFEGTIMNRDELCLLFGVTDQDFERVRRLGKLMAPKIDEFIGRLYIYFKEALGPDFETHFPDAATIARAQSAARRAWLEFFEARWDDAYLKSRERIGDIHAQIQVEPLQYLAAMNKAIELWSIDLYSGGIEEHEWPATIAALRRVTIMESALVVDVYSRRTGEVIGQQSRALIDMSTPIAALWDGILMLPIVGILDSRRAEDIMQRMLEQVAEKQAIVFILDISGVAVVDTAVANHLIRMTKAARLMGCETIVSGLSPSVARTIVELGIEVGDMRTTGNLRDALRVAFDRAGVEQKLERR
jgi:rsbT co-antagonist protein RsbR